MPTQEQSAFIMQAISNSLKRLYMQHKHNRDAYEEAVAQQAHKMMPGDRMSNRRAERRQFVKFALDVFDKAKADGV
jgi:hypothetical protein